MKVRKNGHVIIINDRLKARYESLGYEVIEDKKEKTKNDVSSHSDADKEK